MKNPRTNTLVFSLPFDLPVERGPVRLGAVFCIDGTKEAHLWVDDIEAAVGAFVCLAAALRADEEAPEEVRRVAAGVYAVLGNDVPTEPGLA